MLSLLALSLSLASYSYAELHQLLVGTFGTKSLYTLEFDDANESLSLLKNTSTTAASSWIAFSHDKEALYGTSFTSDQTTWVSYDVQNATELTAHNKTLQINGTSPSIFVVAADQAPHDVYGVVFGSGGSGALYGAVMSVDDNGALKEVVQLYSYANDSGVHGTALTKDVSFYYSADDSGNKLWTHAVDRSTGKLTLVDVQDAPTEGANPRHVTVHESGKYLYVILEEANLVAQYSLDAKTGVPAYHNVSYSLIPPNVSDSSSYWSDEVALSHSGRFLWATSRGRDTSTPGYISAFKLSADGAIEQQLFLAETESSGGTANSASPSPFSDQYAALTDSSVGFVDIWKIRDDHSSADVVARVNIEDGGCCANAVWYS